MKKLNVTVAALLLMGFTGLAYAEMGKCNGMQNPNMKNKSDMMQQGNQGMMQNQKGMMHGNQGMMKNSTSQDQVNKVKQCVNAATTLQEIENCKVGMMQGNQGMMQNQKGMMQGNQGMMKMEGGNMENKPGKCKGN